MTESLPSSNPPHYALVKRLERIDACFDLARQEVADFINGESYAVEQYFDPQTREYVYRAKVIERPPVSLSIVISDFLHVASATLDNIAWIVSRGSKTVGNSFPIYSTVAAYRAVWTKRSGYYDTREMPVEAQAIIEDEQPYHRGNGHKTHPLWILRSLSNADKHQALHLCGATVQKTEFSIPKQEGVDVAPPRFFRGPFVDGGILARQPIPTTHVKGQGEAHLRLGFAFAVAFAQNGPGRGRNVEQALLDMRNAVFGILKRLQPFLGWEPPSQEPPPVDIPDHETRLD